jgi:hypothetical protein
MAANGWDGMALWKWGLDDCRTVPLVAWRHALTFPPSSPCLDDDCAGTRSSTPSTRWWWWAAGRARTWWSCTAAAGPSSTTTPSSASSDAVPAQSRGSAAHAGKQTGGTEEPREASPPPASEGVGVYVMMPCCDRPSAPLTPDPSPHHPSPFPLPRPSPTAGPPSAHTARWWSRCRPRASAWWYRGPPPTPTPTPAAPRRPGGPPWPSRPSWGCMGPTLRALPGARMWSPSDRGGRKLRDTSPGSSGKSKTPSVLREE